MICRTCGEDYEADQVAVCPYCGAANPLSSLRGAAADEVEELGPLVMVAEARGDGDLERMRAALDQAGIPLLVQRRSLVESFGLIALIRPEHERVECHEILVPEQLVERAAEVLVALAQGEP
jgi:hypothetical protein